MRISEYISMYNFQIGCLKFTFKKMTRKKNNLNRLSIDSIGSIDPTAFYFVPC